MRISILILFLATRPLLAHTVQDQARTANSQSVTQAEPDRLLAEFYRLELERHLEPPDSPRSLAIQERLDWITRRVSQFEPHPPYEPNTPPDRDVNWILLYRTNPRHFLKVAQQLGAEKRRALVEKWSDLPDLTFEPMIDLVRLTLPTEERFESSVHRDVAVLKMELKRNRIASERKRALSDACSKFPADFLAVVRAGSIDRDGYHLIEQRMDVFRGKKRLPTYPFLKNPDSEDLKKFATAMASLPPEEVARTIQFLSSSEGDLWAHARQRYLEVAREAARFHTAPPSYGLMMARLPEHYPNLRSPDQSREWASYLFFSAALASHFKAQGCAIPLSTIERINEARRRALAFASPLEKTDTDLLLRLWSLDEKSLRQEFYQVEKTLGLLPAIPQTLLLLEHYRHELLDQSAAHLGGTSEFDGPLANLGKFYADRVREELDQFKGELEKKDGKALAERAGRVKESGLWVLAKLLEEGESSGITSSALSRPMKDLLTERREHFFLLLSLFDPDSKAVLHDEEKKKVILRDRHGIPKVYATADYEEMIREHAVFGKLIAEYEKLSAQANTTRNRWFEGVTNHLLTPFLREEYGTTSEEKARVEAENLIRKSRMKLRDLGVPLEIAEHLDALEKQKIHKKDKEYFERTERNVWWHAAIDGASVAALPFVAANGAARGGYAALMLRSSLVGATVGGTYNFAGQVADIRDGKTGQTDVRWKDVWLSMAKGGGLAAGLSLVPGQAGKQIPRVLGVGTINRSLHGASTKLEQGRPNAALVDALMAGTAAYLMSRASPGGSSGGGNRAGERSPPKGPSFLAKDAEVLNPLPAGNPQTSFPKGSPANQLALPSPSHSTPSVVPRLPAETSGSSSIPLLRAQQGAGPRVQTLERLATEYQLHSH